MNWLRKHFSVNVWCSLVGARGDYTLVRIDVDWFCGPVYVPYVSLTLGLLGLHVGVTYWPGGKA